MAILTRVGPWCMKCHYLGLHHTFNPSGACQSNTYSAGDYIVDTPAQLNPDFGSGSSDCGSASDFDNFMNYSYDRFMDTFTRGTDQPHDLQPDQLPSQCLHPGL